MPIRSLDDVALDGEAVGVRVDINSPVSPDGDLLDDARLRAHVDTLSEVLDRGGRVAVLAHQGRPGGDEFTPLAAHAERLDELLDFDVGYVDSVSSVAARDAVAALDAGEAVLLENTRFYSEEYEEFEPERAADTYLVSRLASVLDRYVNDAFAAAHRSQPSLVGFPVRVPACVGRVMETELDVLGDIASTPTPRVYVLGGAKVTDALRVARDALERDLAADVLTAGLVANVFLVADGVDVGDVSRETLSKRGLDDAIHDPADLLAAHGDRIHLPSDVAVARDGERVELPVADLPPRAGEAVKDVGAATLDAYAPLLADAGTAVLNGPAGVFEDDLFARGTRELFEAVSRAEYSIVGGGDSAAAIRKFDLSGFDHVSTGGGATMRLLCDEPLPAVEVLRTAEP